MNAQHNAHSRGGGFEVSLSLLMTEDGLRITDDKEQIAERENAVDCHALRARIDGVTSINAKAYNNGKARNDGVAHGDALFANLGQFQNPARIESKKFVITRLDAVKAWQSIKFKQFQNSTAHFKFVIASKFAEFAWQSMQMAQSRKRTAENGNFAPQNCGLSRCARIDGVAHGDALFADLGQFKTLPAMLVEVCDE